MLMEIYRQVIGDRGWGIGARGLQIDDCRLTIEDN